MSKIAASKTTKQERVQEAKRAFVLALMDLSWRLATVFMVPVLIGVAIDQSRDTSNATVIGVIVGIVFSILFIIKMGLEANKS